MNKGVCLEVILGLHFLDRSVTAAPCYGYVMHAMLSGVRTSGVRPWKFTKGPWMLSQDSGCAVASLESAGRTWHER